MRVDRQCLVCKRSAHDLVGGCIGRHVGDADRHGCEDLQQDALTALHCSLKSLSEAIRCGHSAQPSLQLGHNLLDVGHAQQRALSDVQLQRPSLIEHCKPIGGLTPKKAAFATTANPRSI